MVDIYTRLGIMGAVAGLGGYLVYKNWDKVSRTAMGAILAGSGIGIALVGQQYFKETKPAKIRLICGGLAITGVGGYYLTEPYIKTLLGFKPLSKNDRVSVAITNPEPATNWCNFGSGKIEAKVVNLEDKQGQVYVGLTIVEEKTGKYKDYALRSVALKPLDSAETSWGISMNDLPVGNWSIHVACWAPEAPQRGVENPNAVKIADDSIRINISEWYKGYCMIM